MELKIVLVGKVQGGEVERWSCGEVELWRGGEVVKVVTRW
jgi:hypothetical protein